jgi:hypothetical protein
LAKRRAETARVDDQVLLSSYRNRRYRANRGVRHRSLKAVGLRRLRSDPERSTVRAYLEFLPDDFQSAVVSTCLPSHEGSLKL